MTVEAVDTIVAIVTQAAEQRCALTARQAAEAAWYPGHSLVTVEAIEALINRHRAEDAQALAAMDEPARAAA